MSELTNERLNEIASGQNTVSIPEAVELARELREAREEIERLKGDNAALLKQWNDLDLRNEQRHHEWTDKLLTLTAERDEARRDVEKWVATVGNASRLVDSLTAELAALKSAPGMEEVDALAYWPDHEFKSQQYTKIQQLADLARRSIASRQKLVEGLLAVESLILESKGVAGLHLNGDLAEWDELRSGGRFGDWLYKFDDALEIVKGK